MPNNWKKYKLREVAKLKKASIRPDQFNGEDYIGLEHISQETFLIDGLGKAEDVTSNKYRFEAGDILYGKIRPYFKKAYRPKFSGICSTDILVIQTKNVNIVSQDYLYQIIKTQFFTDRAVETSSGTKMPRADWNSLSNIDLTIPQSLPEQQAIASILSSLDDKIELNLQINKTLEEMAMTLYKHWFVDFGPFKDGEFVDSELGLIPEGWRVLELGEVATLVAGGDKPDNFTNQPNELNQIPIYSNGIANEGLYGYTDKPRINQESITVSARGTIGYVCLRVQPFVPIVRLIAVTPNEEFVSSKYLYLWLKNQNISGTGTTQQQLTVPDFRTSKIIIPNIERVKEFTLIVNSMFENIPSNKLENQILTQTRDTLLPKLISGEVRVKEAEQTLAAIL